MRLGNNRSHSLRKPKWLKTVTVIEVDITTSATGGLSIDVPFACTVIGMKAISTAANALATVQLSDGTNVVTNELDIAVLGSAPQAVTVDPTYYDFVKGASFVLTTNGAADRAKVLIEVLPR